MEIFSLQSRTLLATYGDYTETVQTAKGLCPVCVRVAGMIPYSEIPHSSETGSRNLLTTKLYGIGFVCLV